MDAGSELNIPLLEPDVSLEDFYGLNKRKSKLWLDAILSIKLSFERPECFPLAIREMAKFF
jgi:hypothetical protein